MDRQRPMDYGEHDAPGLGEDPGIGAAASATELTGLLYRAPADPEERRAAQALTPTEVPAVGPRRREEQPKG